ncbi:hypothetical protein M758_1G289500 [Ceratodon purpureus]|nr:hypothetical protein M758_1G289500 [Ceratodon purpureus]
MALLLPQCTSSLESLHQLASLRQRVSVDHYRRSRRSVRAEHGATESSTRTQVTLNDHIKIPSSEPCCKISSIVMAPRKPARRSSRLRAKKGREASKTEPAEDIEAAEWVSRVLGNNGIVEIDPVTMAEVNGGRTETTNTHKRIASLTTSSEVPDYFPPRGPGFPRFPGVPFEVLVAAGSAVALATVAAILNALSNQKVGAKPRQSDSEGYFLGSDFAGEPVKSSNGSNSPQLTKDRKLPAEVLASTAGLSAGAAILTAFDLQPGSVRTGLDYSSMPLPPSLSKNGPKRDSPPREQQRKWDSVAPFFTPSRSPESDPRPDPSTSRWSEEKYKDVSPFFSSDQSVGNGSSLENVTPFFADDQQGSEIQNRTSSESVTPFFADDQGRELKNGPSLEAVTPFFADERGSENKNGGSLENVTPFFADERGSENKNGGSLENVTPFFADEQGSGNKNGGSLENVTPFFADERGSGNKNGGSLENVTPFFADERQGRTSTGGSQLKYQNVTPFFPDDRVGRSGSTRQLSGSGFREQSGWDGESNEAMRDSLADSAAKLPRMVNFRGRTPMNSTQFTDQRSVGNERVFAAVREDLLSGPMQSEGKQMLAEMANRAQGQHREFMEGTIEDRFGSSFGGEEAPSVTRDLTPAELALLEEIKEEEARQHAKFQALQAAFPALAIGAGAVGALAGVDGAFEMVGVTATASFISYELLWANKRRELLDELSRITDHHKLFSFLRRRKILKDDC